MPGFLTTQGVSVESHARTACDLGLGLTQQRMQATPKRRGALHSGLDIPDSLRDFWYPVEFSGKLTLGRPKAFTLFQEAWHLLRDVDGRAICRMDLSDPR